MILVFDLDDTLYDEMTYVRSGFAAVASFASAKWGVARTAFLRGMLQHLEREGRGRVFNDTLRDHGILVGGCAKQCLAVYRAHRPRIRLGSPARRCIRRFAQVPKYVVTDGNALVQELKVEALGLAAWFEKVLVTHRYGRRNSKPSSYCFERIAQLQRVAPEQICYVADNPHKDFVGIRPLGFRTIRLLAGPYGLVRAKPGHDAELSIESLDQITWELLESINLVRTSARPARRSGR